MDSPPSPSNAHLFTIINVVYSHNSFIPNAVCVLVTITFSSKHHHSRTYQYPGRKKNNVIRFEYHLYVIWISKFFSHANANIFFYLLSLLANLRVISMPIACPTDLTAMLNMMAFHWTLSCVDCEGSSMCPVPAHCSQAHLAILQSSSTYRHTSLQQ